MVKKELDAVALTVRSLTIDAIESAKSGHPGTPLGLAEFGALLFGEFLVHNKNSVQWINRDRFLLSVGHASMWLYSLLTLSGYLSLEDIKKFRQLHSKTPGHPELGKTLGVEMTTGPLGEGFASAVGIAIAETMLAQRFNRKNFTIISHYTYVLSGDGCLMEGVTSEAASLAGQLQLGKLIIFYDKNNITIDGTTEKTFTEDIEKRFLAYGWSTFYADPYDYNDMRKAINNAKDDINHPSLIILPSTIGKGSPNTQGTATCHGAPLGDLESQLTKIQLGLSPHQKFFIDPLAIEFMNNRMKKLENLYNEWQDLWEKWKKTYPKLFQEFLDFKEQPQQNINFYWKQFSSEISPTNMISTREASGKILNTISKNMQFLIGGSADLASSNKTYIHDAGEYQSSNHSGRNILFGVREHAMAAIVNGLNLYGFFRAYASTFLVFSDHMRPSIRLSAIMKIPSLFIFSHDSFHVGEDGPTHQPIEHLEGLRQIPNVQLFRPADHEETQWAWFRALSTKNKPSILCLTRQKVAHFEKSLNWREEVSQGAYIVKEVCIDSDFKNLLILVATGSEVTLALETQILLQKQKISSRVISMVCREIFLKQDSNIQKNLIPHKNRAISIEAGIAGQWHQLCTHTFCIKQFGVSGNPQNIAEYFNFTIEKLFHYCKEIFYEKTNED